MGPEMSRGVALRDEMRPTCSSVPPSARAKRGRATHSAPVPKPHMKKMRAMGMASRAMSGAGDCWACMTPRWP